MESLSGKPDEATRALRASEAEVAQKVRALGQAAPRQSELD